MSVYKSTNLDHMLSIEHFREVAAQRLGDGYIGPHLMLAYALDEWHDSYTDNPNYRNVWCGIVWC